MTDTLVKKSMQRAFNSFKKKHIYYNKTYNTTNFNDFESSEDIEIDAIIRVDLGSKKKLEEKGSENTDSILIITKEDLFFLGEGEAKSSIIKYENKEFKVVSKKRRESYIGFSTYTAELEVFLEEVE